MNYREVVRRFDAPELDVTEWCTDLLRLLAGERDGYLTASAPTCTLGEQNVESW